MTPGALVGALEIGGTHVTAALVSRKRRSIEAGTLQRTDLSPEDTRDALVGAIVGAASRVARPDVARWGVATPGPFDYDGGVALIRGVVKLDALYGVDLRAELIDALTPTPQRISFLNDADAFLIGEWWAGAARRHERAIGVTLGTGLGSAFLERGDIVETDPRVAPEGRLDLIPFRGTAVEDILSRRGLRAAYGRDGADVVEIAARARGGERHASDVLHAFGGGLGEFLAPWLERFVPTCLVFGGSISRCWDLWSEAFRATCAPARSLASCGVAEHVDEAPLLGAAHHAERSD